MKNAMRNMGIIAMIAVIGFSMAACKDKDEGDETLSGTYTHTITNDSGETITEEITFTDSNFTMKRNGEEAFKGTYTISDNTLTLTVTWSTNEEGAPPVGSTFTATISGNTITAEGQTWTKQGSNKNNVAKTLVITGYPGSMEAGDNHFTAIAPVGTDWETLNDDLVAMAYIYDEDDIYWVVISNGTATIQLKDVVVYDNTGIIAPWTGSGTFDVWIAPKGTGPGAKWYKASNVAITQATTTIAASSFVFVIEDVAETETLAAHRGTWTKEGAILTIEATQFTVSSSAAMNGTYQITEFMNRGNGKRQYNFRPENETSSWAIECQLVNGNLVLDRSGPDEWHGTWTKQGSSDD